MPLIKIIRLLDQELLRAKKPELDQFGGIPLKKLDSVTF